MLNTTRSVATPDGSPVSLDNKTPDYALIVGTGRSGTSWLLDLFDLSDRTLCRNEPYGCLGSPLAELAVERLVERPSCGILEARWDDAVRWTCAHFGERDRPIAVAKRFFWPVSRSLGIYRAIRGPRLRRYASAVIPSLGRAEWKLPWLVGSQARLQRAKSILKLVGPPGWTTFVLRRRPNIPVFHIIRHPGGFLNSWAQRYVRGRDVPDILQQNRRRLVSIAEADPQWSARFTDIDSMSLEESELSCWLYVNETMYMAGTGKRSYHRVIYESLTADPVAIMRGCYAACGLEWTRRVEARVRRSGRQSQSIASAWRKGLRDDQIVTVERILEQSEMKAWWDRPTEQSLTE